MRAWIAYAAALLLMAGLFSPPAAAEPPSQTAPGVAAYEAGEYERAYELLKPAADAGDVQARYLMARLLSGDLPKRTDYSLARQYLDQTTRCVSPAALNLYAYLLAPDDANAPNSVYRTQAKIYKEASAAGSLKAHFNLGLVTIRQLEMHVIGGSYLVEAARKGHLGAREVLDRVSAQDLGEEALAAAEKTAREEPFDERWPSLASINRQCPGLTDRP